MPAELEILGAPSASEEQVVLMVIRGKGLVNDSDVPESARVEITKAPFHQKMKLGQGAVMSRADAEWHLAKSQSWSAGMPLALTILTMDEAQKLKSKAKTAISGNAEAPDYSAMKVAELRGVLLEKGIASAEGKPKP
jgi:hypothetical protein